MSYVVLHSGRYVIDLSVKALIGGVGVAFVLACVGNPLYQHYFRPSYANVAESIAARVGSAPIFATDHTAIGLSIVAELNERRRSRPPITIPPAAFTSGFVLAEVNKLMSQVFTNSPFNTIQIFLSIQVMV